MVTLIVVVFAVIGVVYVGASIYEQIADFWCRFERMCEDLHALELRVQGIEKCLEDLSGRVDLVVLRNPKP